jgi:hypothetical protein
VIISLEHCTQLFSDLDSGFNLTLKISIIVNFPFYTPVSRRSVLCDWVWRAGWRPHRFPHNNFSSVYWIFTKLDHMIALWKGKNPIYFGVKGQGHCYYKYNFWQQGCFRTITLVLYIGSLTNLATWFLCGRGRTLFILGSLGQSHHYYKYNFWQQDRFHTITLVLYIGSLLNFATWFPCGRGRTLFILGSLPLYHLIIYIDGRILWCTHFLF